MSRTRESLDSLSQPEEKQLQPKKYVYRYLRSEITVKGEFTLDKIKKPTQELRKKLCDHLLISNNDAERDLKRAIDDQNYLSKVASSEKCSFVIKVKIPESLLPLPDCRGYGEHPIKAEHIVGIFPDQVLYYKFFPLPDLDNIPAFKKYMDQHGVECLAFQKLCLKTGFDNPDFVDPDSEFEPARKTVIAGKAQSSEGATNSVSPLYQSAIGDTPKLSKSLHSFVRSEARLENNEVKTENCNEVRLKNF